LALSALTTDYREFNMHHSIEGLLSYVGPQAVLPLASALAATLYAAFSRTMGSRVALLAAVISIGAYYVVSDEWWLTNVEFVASFPIFVTLIALLEAGRGGRWRNAWLFLAGTVALLAQFISWCDLHWLLLLCPLGIFSAIAVGKGSRGPGRSDLGRLAWFAALAVSLAAGLPTGGRLVKIVAAYRRSLAAMDLSQRLPYQDDLHPWFGDMQAEAGLLSRPGALTGKIFVWGSPMIYLSSGREPASAVQGWNHVLMTRRLHVTEEQRGEGCHRA
jgi:hypothetical protein